MRVGIGLGLGRIVNSPQSQQPPPQRQSLTHTLLQIGLTVKKLG